MADNFTFYDSARVTKTLRTTDTGTAHVPHHILAGSDGAGLATIASKLRVSAMPYLFDIAEGNVVGHSEFERFAINADIDITSEDIWPTGGAYTFPAAEAGLEILSSSTDDDGDPAGTGVRTVTLYYLDDAFAEKTEVITLDGTTVVPTVATDIYRVQSLRVLTVGSVGAAVGTITLRHLTNTPIYTTIEAGQTRSRNSVYTVPAGKTLYITSIFAGCTSTAANGATVTLRATYDHIAGAARTFFMPHAEIMVGSNGGGIYRPFELPIKFPAGTDLKCSATSLANNASISVGLRGWLE